MLMNYSTEENIVIELEAALEKACNKNQVKIKIEETPIANEIVVPDGPVIKSEVK